jgi:membrane peptidoglycan carboxypeptidase
VTSRADDFDVRFDDDARNGRHRGTEGRGTEGTGSAGATPGSVDYDLGYDGNGWDTQGFLRSADGGYREEFYQSAADPYQQPDTELYQPVPPGAAVGTGTILTDAPAIDAPRRSRRHGAGGPGGSGGPGGPRGPRGRKVKVKGSWWRHWTIRKALGLFLSLIGGLIVLFAVAVVYIYNHTPVPTENMAAALQQESTVYASDGKTLIGRLGNTNRVNLNYSQIPAPIINSVLAAEDRNFFSEGGVSPTGIARAAFSDLTSGGNSLQGGSTITQQFVRNYYSGIGTAQTASRKIKEIFVAMKIGRSKSKPWILENYLNTIYLGQDAYGIGAAVQTYFNIPVSKIGKITYSQAALLAAIIQQPSTYPQPQYRAQLVARWHYVVDGLVKMGKITPADAAQMTFPKFGDYIPQTYGKDVWDPYVLAVVQNELEGVYAYSQSDLYNRGYKIVTTIDESKMKALYAAVIQEEGVINSTSAPMQKYMHVGAVLEDPNTGAIEADYPGPGFPGAKYNGVGKPITQKLCDQIHCEVDMAIYNPEQVGSSFKPYILATAVAQGMNVKTSMLDGQDRACIPPDSQPNTVPISQIAGGGCPTGGSWYPMSNDSATENGAFNPQVAMTYSVNTAYADLWHYVGGKAVLHMASMFGVSLSRSGLYVDAGNNMQDEAGVALGQASLTVAEQATMLATIDNGGTYHRIHIVQSISQGATNYPLAQKSYPVFSSIPSQNTEMAAQVQYGMSQVAYAQGATGTLAGMTDGRPIISKTGTTDFAQSAFYIGAIPQEALAVALFTNHQGKKNDYQTLNGLGNQGQGFGGTWPALMWHTYAENMFLPLQTQTFAQPQFTGATWMLAPKNLLKTKKKPAKHKHLNTPKPGQGVAPSPTATCAPGQITVDCNPITSNGTGNGTGTGATNPTPTPGGFGSNLNVTTPGVTTTQAGAATAGMIGVPLTLLWVRRRERRRHRNITKLPS